MFKRFTLSRKGKLLEIKFHIIYLSNGWSGFFYKIALCFQVFFQIRGNQYFTSYSKHSCHKKRRVILTYQGDGGVRQRPWLMRGGAASGQGREETH
jgi:hypothetical protein